MDMLSVFRIRFDVFVLEQRVDPAIEIDEWDNCAYHFLAFVHEFPVGTGRLLVTGRSARIGRMAVRRECRGRGVGSALMNELVRLSRELGVREVSLHAQVHALEFYSKFGFTAHGGVFDEAGILHQEMTLYLTKPGTED